MSTRLIPCAVLALAGSLFAGQVCDLAFTACPSQLPKGPIAVPMDVIALDAHIPYCQESGKVASSTTPSIMFVIDNSGSMRQTDPQHARYTVVNTLLDSIHAANPATRVGLAIFAGRLSFDSRDPGYFRTMFPGDNTQHDAFVPLTPLDSIFGDGKRAVDTMKALLKTDADGNLIYQTTRAKERTPTGGGGGGGNGGTDITLGFQAALEAMKSSPSPKEAQFIIFLSDGEPRVTDDIRIPLADLYEAGTNTPTTFTVFFDPNSTTPPATLTTMTNNIRANGYSAANPNSNIWTINLPASELQSLLQKSVLSKILTVPASGKSVTVGIAGGMTQTTTVKADTSHFLVEKRMPINAGTTQINFNYAHTFMDTTKHPPVARDTQFAYSLTLQRVPGATLPGYVTASCREQPALGLYADGTALTEVTAEQSRLEARLTPPATGMTCAGCTVEVKPSGSADKETLPLAPAGTAYSGSFSREENATPVPGDGKLQHVGTDSLVLIWVDPENPLNVVRSAFPYRTMLPQIELYAGGKKLDTVTAANPSLEIRLTLPSGEVCNACPVQVSLVKGIDKETVTMTGGASPYKGTFTREVSLTPAPGDGKLSHPVEDSIVLFYQDPLNPAQQVRRAYLYIDFQNILGIQPHNAVARTPATQVSVDGKQWVISEAPGLVVQPTSGGGACCRMISTPLNSANPDSARMVGIIIEASREFTLNLKVYSTLGDFVNSVEFKVPRAEFLKLTPVPGKEARYLRLLWNGLAKDGARAGTGAYIIHTSITLMPLPGLVESGSTSNTVRRVGILRTPG